MTDDDEPRTKPRTPEDTASVQRKHELAEAVHDEGEIVASGRRRVNRPRDEKKQAAINAFVKDKCIVDYHVWPEDIADENDCLWEPRDPTVTDPDKDDRLPPPKSLHDTLADEIIRSYELAKQPRPVMAAVWATKLLESDLDGKLGVLSDLSPDRVEVDLVLAHLESFAYDIPQRMALGIARRTVILLLNKSKFVHERNASNRSGAG